MALVLAACGGPSVSSTDAHVGDGATPDSSPDLTDGAHSGTRLKITYWVFPDGTRQWNAFYDSQRKETCYIYPAWPDGNYYCTPSGANIVYTDAGCTAKVAQNYHDPNCAPTTPTYALDWSYTACSSGPSHLYLRGSQVTLAQYYDKGSDGTCYGPYTSTNYDFYSLGAEVVPTDLVKLAIGGPMGSAQLGVRFMTSSDGLAFPWNIHDAMLGDDCYTSYAGDGATSARCAPSSSSYAAYSHDSACSTTELAVSKACGSPRYAVAYPYSACAAAPDVYYTVGSAVASTPLFTPSGGQCYAATADPTANYFGVGQQLDLAVLNRAPDTVAGHRMQLIHMTTPDGLRWRDYPIYDSEKNAECTPFTLPDGTTRCVAWGGYSQTYYSNSTCTSPIDLVELQTGPSSCGPPPASKFASKYVPPPPGTCAYSYEVHEMGAVYAGAVYTNYGSCARYAPAQTTFYQLGQTVPLTDFASVTVVADQ
jgi:hypothetical protein